MDFINILLIVISVLNIFLALIVLRGFRKAVNFFFGIFILGAAFWSLSIALFRNTLNVQDAISYIHLIYLSGTLVPIFFLLFAKSFIGKKFTLNFYNLGYFIVPVILAVLVFTPLFVNKIVFNGIDKSVILGPVYLFWVGYFCLYMSLASYWLLREFLKTKGLIRQQLGYIIVAILFPLIGALPFNIFYPIFGNYKYIFVGPIFLTIMVGVITYAIIIHRLMDIRFVAARSLAYTLLLLILGAIYSTGLFLASTYFIGNKTDVMDLTVSTLLALFMAFTFQPLKKALEKFTDAVFYQGRYDMDLLLARIGSVMSTNIELRPLTSQIIQVLIEQMRISKGALVILGEGQTSVYDVIDIGFSQKLNITFDQISAFFSSQEIMVFDEMEENQLKNLMRGLGISAIKVLKVKGEVVGLLILGEKSSGEIYSNQDLKVLEILAPEMAVAIQNAEGYDKIKKFNITLTDEINKATTDLKSANQKLQLLDHLKDDFVSIASHELRTPMTAIRSYAWMALHRSDTPLSKNLEKYITRILISTERLVNLVNDMLNISRIESGKIEINPEPIDLMSLVKDIIDEVYYSKSEEKRVEFVVSKKTVPKAFADPEKLRQVFLNLVGNSLKFTPAGGKITFDFFTDGKTVEISVSDTGVGISKEDLSRLFHKFGRLDNSYTASATSGGTGLGLYISKNLVELMHGRMWGRSEGAGRGATFSVSLPVASPEHLKNIDQYRTKPEGEVKPLEPVAV